MLASPNASVEPGTQDVNSVEPKSLDIVAARVFPMFFLTSFVLFHRGQLVFQEGALVLVRKGYWVIA